MAEGGKTVAIGPYVAYLDQPLGRGTFGEVFLAKTKDKKQKVATKRIKYRNESDASNSFMVKMGRTEIRSAMALNDHPNIINFLDYYDDGSCFWLTMEYCPLGDLDVYMHDNCHTFDLTTKIAMMLQCVQGIAYMHSFEPPMVHRDIKPKNFLVVGGHDNNITVKATDFGVAKFLEKTHKDCATTYGKSLFMNTFVGSPAFMAPEMFEMNEELHYSSAVDTFSLGLLLLVLLEISPQNKTTIPKLRGIEMKLYTVGQTLKEAMTSGQVIPEIIPDVPDDSETVRKLKEIIRQMTSTAPKQRPELWIVQDDLEKLQYSMGHSIKTDVSYTEEFEREDSIDMHRDSTLRPSDRIIDGGMLATVVETLELKQSQAESGAVAAPENVPASGHTYRDCRVNPDDRIIDDDILEILEKTLSKRNSKEAEMTKTTEPEAEENTCDALVRTPIKHPMYDVTNYGDFKPVKDIWKWANPETPAPGTPSQPKPAPRKAPDMKRTPHQEKVRPQYRKPESAVSPPTNPQMSPPRGYEKPEKEKSPIEGDKSDGQRFSKEDLLKGSNPVTPAVAPDYDPDDLLVTARPRDKPPGQISKSRFEHFQNKPTVPEDRARPPVRQGTNALTEEEKRNLYDVSNIQDFNDIKKLMEKFNKK